jgi:hypothetical protein
MRVLVVGSVPVSVRGAQDELERAGHEVVRCHDDVGPAFPCAALQDGRACPLDAAPVDVVLDLHDARTAAPSPYEDGATCAIRQHVPLVVASDGRNAFDQWSTSHVTRASDVVEACEQAAHAPLVEHSALAIDATRRSLEQAGIDPAGATAVVRRRAGSLDVRVGLPVGCDETTQSMVATRVVAALRAHDHVARGIDVSVL